MFLQAKPQVCIFKCVTVWFNSCGMWWSYGILWFKCCGMWWSYGILCGLNAVECGGAMEYCVV